MTYDLHIHSCLSPCADDDMTPASIAGFAKLNGIDLIAVADHNAADNLSAAACACEAYGVTLLPAMEITTQEEIHVLAYFPSLEAALRTSDMLYNLLLDLPYDPAIWGRQLVMDENDNIIAEKNKLLPAALPLDLYAVKALCDEAGAIAVPAHVDKDSYSLLSVLGFAPEDLPFAAYEVRRPEHALPGLLQSGRLPAGPEIITSSDAHSLMQISEFPRILPAASVLRSLLLQR